MKVMEWEWMWFEKAFLLVGPERQSEATLTRSRDELWRWSTSNGYRGQPLPLIEGVKAALRSLKLSERLECMLLASAVIELERLDRLYERGKEEMDKN